MKTMLMLFGGVLLHASPTEEVQLDSDESYPQLEIAYQDSHLKKIHLTWNESSNEVIEGRIIRLLNEEEKELKLEEIPYVEEEELLDLGFDTKDYLPEDFDAYKLYVNLKDFEFIDLEMEAIESIPMVELGTNFDPYTDIIDVGSLNYIDMKKIENLELGFDHTANLPEGFDPYAKEEKESTYGVVIDTALLPKGFDPYTDVIPVDSLNYIEDEVEMDLDKYRKYLPNNFDAYQK